MYNSPTDMGVNRAGFAITNDEVCREAACQEIIRRYLIAEVDYKKGKIEETSLERAKLLMNELGLKSEDRSVVTHARNYAEEKRNSATQYENLVVMAMELPNKTIVTGRSSNRMVAAAALVLNGIKILANIPDNMLLITKDVFDAVQSMKSGVLKSDRATLTLEEVLIALTVSGTQNREAAFAAEKLNLLKGCKAHCTAILSDQDEQMLMALGIDVTCDPEYVTTNLYI